MKVTLRNSYNYNDVAIDATGNSYYPEMVVDLDTKDVLKILEIQVEFEALQQRLKPLYEACDDARKIRQEADDKKAKEDKEAADAVKTAEESFN